MNSTKAYVRLQSDQHSPAEVGLWIFILADLCIFAMYFGVFAWDKTNNPEQFAQGQATLNAYLGGFNTLVLLISSYFMAGAVQAAREPSIARYRIGLLCTILCGMVFLIVKTAEYTEKFSAGFHIASNEFYRDYFAFTGFHLVHVVLGLSLLLYFHLTFRSAEQIANNIQNIEGLGLYWHMVDLLWVVLFTLIYLVP